MSKRELIDTGTDKRYVRRDESGSSTSVDVGRSLSSDKKRGEARCQARPGDKGDRELGREDRHL